MDFLNMNMIQIIGIGIAVVILIILVIALVITKRRDAGAAPKKGKESKKDKKESKKLPTPQAPPPNVTPDTASFMKEAPRDDLHLLGGDQTQAAAATPYAAPAATATGIAGSPAGEPAQTPGAGLWSEQPITIPTPPPASGDLWGSAAAAADAQVAGATQETPVAPAPFGEAAPPAPETAPWSYQAPQPGAAEAAPPSADSAESGVPMFATDHVEPQAGEPGAAVAPPVVPFSTEPPPPWEQEAMAAQEPATAPSPAPDIGGMPWTPGAPAQATPAATVPADATPVEPATPELTATIGDQSPQPSFSGWSPIGAGPAAETPAASPSIAPVAAESAPGVPLGAPAIGEPAPGVPLGAPAIGEPTPGVPLEAPAIGEPAPGVPLGGPGVAPVEPAPPVAEVAPPPAPTPAAQPIAAAPTPAPAPAGPATQPAAAGLSAEAFAPPAAEPTLVALSDIISTTNQQRVNLQDPDVRKMLKDLAKSEIDLAQQYKELGQNVDAVLQLTEAKKICEALDMASHAKLIDQMIEELRG